MWYDENGEISSRFPFPSFFRSFSFFDSRQVCKNVKKAPEKLPPMYAGDLYKVFALVSDPNVRLSRAQFQVFYLPFSLFRDPFLLFSYPLLIILKAVGKAGKLNMDISLQSAGVETVVKGKLIHLLAAKQLIRYLPILFLSSLLSFSSLLGF